jgi:hypothetical protein
MGIKDYHKWMKEQYSEAFKTKWQDTYDHIYIDLNCLLHYNSYGMKSIDELFIRLFATLDKLFQNITPTKTITLAADGVAPLAKTLLQRDRRLSTCRASINTNTSSLMFSPGTIFMNNLEEKLTPYMNQINCMFNVTTNYQIKCPGEAELKLKYQMELNLKKYDCTNTHIIFTNDADVIAMFGSFNMEYFSNIFILCNIKEQIVLSIGKLFDLHTDNVGMSILYGYDFMAISILLGNDYLPKIFYVSLQKLWNVYTNIVKSDTNGLICRNNNELYINNEFLNLLLIGVIKQTSTNIIKPVGNIDINLYTNYLDGLSWCLDMYSKGKCIDYKYMYNYTDDPPPHPYGIILSIKANKTLITQNINNPIDYKIYPVIIMPYTAYALLDEQYQCIPEKIPELYEEEKCKQCIKLYDIKTKLNQKARQKLSTGDKQTDDFKKELYNARSNLTLHKKLHSCIAYDDLDKIISIVSEYIN